MEKLGPSRAWSVLFARLVIDLMFCQGAVWRAFR